MTQPLKLNAKLTDFDFSVDAVPRSKHKNYDGYIAFRNAGKLRRFSSFEINLTAFAREYEIRYDKLETLAIGVKKYKEHGAVIISFNNPGLGANNADITRSDNGVRANNKGLILKALRSLNIEVPDKKDTSINVYFDLSPIEGMPKTFLVVPKKKVLHDSTGEVVSSDL